MVCIENQLAVETCALIGWMTLNILAEVLQRYWSRTKDLPYSHRAEIAEAFVATIHGCVTGLAGLYIAGSCYHDALHAKMDLTFTICTIATAYFKYDLLSMYYTNSQKIDEALFNKRLISFIYAQPLMITHHVTIMICFLPTMLYLYDVGHFFIGCLFCMELSSPYVDGRIILSRIGLKSTKLYVINGIVMMIVFFIVRVLTFPMMYGVYISQQNLTSSHIQALMDIPITLHLCSALILAPQLYWLNLMVQGFINFMKKDE